MKKIGVLILLCLIIFVQFVYAEGILGSLEDKIDSVQDTKENVENSINEIKETDGNSLVEEWKKRINENSFFIKLNEVYEKFSPFTDPVFESILLVTPSLSGVFILSLALFILFIVYIYKILHLSFFSNGVSFGISFFLTIAISVLGLVKYAAEAIVNFVGLFGTWWMQLILAIAILIGIVFAFIYSEAVAEFFRGMKERREKMKNDLEEIETKAAKEDVKTFAEAIRKGLSKK